MGYRNYKPGRYDLAYAVSVVSHTPSPPSNVGLVYHGPKAPHNALDSLGMFAPRPRPHLTAQTAYFMMLIKKIRGRESRKGSGVLGVEFILLQ